MVCRPGSACIFLNLAETLLPDDEDLFGDCTVTKSTGSYRVIERLTLLEYVCENTCVGAVADDVDYKVACRFESSLASWEKTPGDIQP